MTRASSVIVLGLLVVLAVGQLSISSPSYVNFYSASQSSSTPSAYYDTGFYQVFTTGSGYSVASEATGLINLFENPSCVGTNSSQFFCVNTANNTKFNQINLTTGVEYEIFTFNESIYSLQAYLNTVQVFFSSDLATLQVINPPSTESVCNLSVSAGNTFNNVLYFNGQVMTSPASSCYDDCYYNLYNCSATENVTELNVTLPTDLFETSSYYLTTIMWLQSGANTQIVGFPYGSYNSNPQEYHGYIVFSTNSSVNSTYINSTLANYTQVIQINLTNILVLNTVGELQQYAFNFETLTFAPAGPVLSVPNANQISVSPITNNSNQVAIVYSNAQGSSNFYINLNTMTISNWVYAQPAQTFANGSTFSFTESGFFTANGSNVTYVYDTTYTPNPVTFIPYSFPQGYTNYALALVDSQSNPAQLFVQYLNGNLSTNFITIAGVSPLPSNIMFTAFTVNGSEFVAVAWDMYYQYVYAWTNTGGQVLQASIDYYNYYVVPMFFISNTTNLVYVYTDEYLTTYSTVNGSQAQQNEYTQQFGSFQKISETQFVAWTVNFTSGSVNSTLWFYIIDAFTQAVQATYVIQNTTVTDATDISVYATLTATGSLQALYISENLQTLVAPTWILYADNSSYAGNISSLVYPGPSNSALFCNINFGGEMVNCTNYQVTDSNNNNGAGSSGSSGTIIVIIIVVLVLLAAGFFVRRNMIHKRAGATTSGITLAKV